jgi:FMN reductase
MSRDVVVLVGNPRPGSRTRALADTVTDALLERLAARGHTLSGRVAVELGEVVSVSFGATAPVPGTADDPFETVRGARLLMVATPTYKGVYTGLLKVFLDRYRPGDLAGVVAVGVAVAASEDHRRSVGDALQSLLVALGTRVPAGPVALLELEVSEAERLVGEWVDKYADSVAACLCEVGSTGSRPS